MVRAEIDCVQPPPPSFFRQEDDSGTATTCVLVVSGMGDVLPPKRQTVVDRLRKRFEVYRRHHNGCLPRYEQSANALYEKQHQDTLLFRQRYLESKAKKAKNKGDHHRTSSVAARESTPDSQKLVPYAKPVKRAQDGSPAVTASDHPKEEIVERSVKPKQSEVLLKNDCGGPTAAAVDNQKLSQKTTQQQQKQQQQQTASATLNFSVQVVQQFKNNNSTQPLPQTVQTNVTVNAFDGNVAGASTESKAIGQPQTSGQSAAPVNAVSATPEEIAPPASSNVNQQNCKQENKKAKLNVRQFEDRTVSDSNSADRFSDTFPTLGFAEDSNGEDVIHPDILKDLIDDVFINSADIMKDFNFEDSVGSPLKSNEKDEIQDLVKDFKETAAASELQQALRDTENLIFNHPMSQQQPQNSQQSLIGNLFYPSVSVMSNMPVMSQSTTAPLPSLSYMPQQQQQQRMMPYRNQQSAPIGSNGGSLNIDFKLTEPNPAALTLKQMAEQHQNMQKQHQQHLSQGLSPASSLRSHFDLDSLTNPMSNFSRSRFLNNAPAVAQKQQQSIFNSPSYEPTAQQSFPGVVPIATVDSTASDIFKQNHCSVSRQISDSEKQQQQQRLQQQQLSIASVDKKQIYANNRIGGYFTDSGGGISSANSNLQIPQNKFVGDANNGRQQISDRLTMSHGNSMQQQVHQQVLNAGSNAPARSQDNQYANIFPYRHQQQHQVNNNNIYNVVTPMQQTFDQHFQPHPMSVNRMVTHRKQSVSSDGGVHLSSPGDQLSSAIPSVPYTQPFISNNPQRFPGSPSNQWRNMHHHQVQHDPSINAPADVFQQQHHHHQHAFNSMSDASVMQQHQNLVVPAGLQHHNPCNKTVVTANELPTSVRGGPRPNLMSPSNSSILHQQPVQNRPAGHLLGASVDGGQMLASEVTTQLTSSANPVYGNHHHQDPNQLNLDFLDNIDGTASDLLNFDQVMQNAGNHFQLLDDM